MMKLGFNEATCMRNSTLAQDVVLAERYGYDYIEIRLDMLQEWLQKHTLSELADIFAVGHLKPWGYNSLEDITFCDSESWAEKRRQLAFACHAGCIDSTKMIQKEYPGLDWITRNQMRENSELARD